MGSAVSKAVDEPSNESMNPKKSQRTSLSLIQSAYASFINVSLSASTDRIPAQKNKAREEVGTR